jgi:chromosome segregation ATPase
MRRANPIPNILAGLLLAVPLAGGCTDEPPEPEDKEDIREAVEIVEDKLGQEVDEARAAFEERIEIFRQKLDELEEKVGEQGVAKLQQGVEALETEFEKHAEDSLEQWKQSKKDLEAQLDELVAAYKKVSDTGT